MCNVVAEFVRRAKVQHRINVLNLLLRFVSTYLHYFLVAFLGCGAIMFTKRDSYPTGRSVAHCCEPTVI
jgi:hypothetical protein